MYYLHGGAGAPNFGDELIARQWLEFLAERSSEPLVFSGYRKPVMDDWYGDRYPGVHLTDALCRFQSGLPKDFWAAFLEGYNFFSGGADTSRMPPDELDRLRSAKVFHMHGGGYINTIWPNHAFYLGLAASLKIHLKTHTVLGTGLGITPIPEPPKELHSLVRDALSSFDLFEVRDLKSYEYASFWSTAGANIVHGTDDAFLYPVSADGPGRTLHLALHSNEQGDAALEQLTDDFLDQFDRTLFWVCHYKDAAQYKAVKKKFPRVQVAASIDLSFKPLPLGPNDFVITSRFHPHLMASRYGARGQYATVGKYSSNKHNSVLHAGSLFNQAGQDTTLSDSSEKMLEMDPERVRKKRERWASVIS